MEPRVLDKAAELTGKDYKDYKLKDADSRGAKDGNEWLYDQAADGGEGFAIPYGKVTAGCAGVVQLWVWSGGMHEAPNAVLM